MGRFERASKRFFLGVLVGFFAGAAATQAGAREGVAARETVQNPAAVVEELRLDLSASLRGDLIAAMQVEMDAVVATAQRNAGPAQEGELATRFDSEAALALGLH